MKTRIVVIFAVIALTPILVAIQDQPSSTQERKDTQQATPATPVSVNCNCTAQTGNGEDKPQGWHKLVTWPEGIATWALIATLGAIVWQAIVSRIAAKAARDGVELQINKERARVRITANELILLPNNATVQWTLENYGATYASVHVACIRLVLTPERETAADYSKCKSAFIGESIKPDNKLPISVLTQLEPDGLTADQLMEIKKDTLFVHFYGFVKYQDLFDRRWRQRIHLRWTMRWGVTIEGMIMQSWELAGPPAENREVSADPSKPRWWQFERLRRAIKSVKHTNSGDKPN